MSRPRFLDCVMTPEVIRGIRERQEAYDKDPEGYERRERQREEDREQERLAEKQYNRECLETFYQEEELRRTED